MEQDREVTVRVMLDISSDSPNPSWAIGEQQIEEVRRLLDTSRKVTRDSFEGPAGGYRGFVIFNSHLQAALPYKIRVCAGVVAVTDKAGHGAPIAPTAYYEDSLHLEAYLLAQAAGRGHGAVVEQRDGPRPGGVARDEWSGAKRPEARPPRTVRHSKKKHDTMATIGSDGCFGFQRGRAGP